MPKIAPKIPPSRASKPTPQPPHIDEQSSTLEYNLIQLTDDMAEFVDVSIFINHALTSSLSRPELLNAHISSGARICSALLQNQSTAIQDNLREIHARVITTRNTGETA